MATMGALAVTLLGLSAVLARGDTLASECSCGYQDPDTFSIYTDSLIVYFNETDALDPDVFVADNFAHRKEKGWNAVYRVGAKSENAQFINDTQFHPQLQVLELLTDPPTTEHLVYGANIESIRKDIQYGSFEAALKPAAQWTGGTALSFGLKYNGSQSLEVDMMNMDDPADATVAQLVNGEWPATDLNTNFTTLEKAGEDPWNAFTTIRVDWNKTNVNFFIGSNNTRALTKHNRTLPEAGEYMFLKTWSTGDTTYMDGPPTGNASKSHVLYVRSFFNSSTWTDADHATYNQRCAAAVHCLTNDTSLRGQSAFSAASEVKWKPAPNTDNIKRNAGIVAACCSSFGIFALINVFIRRTPWAKLKPGAKREEGKTRALRDFLTGSLYKQPAQKAQSVRSSNSSDDGNEKKFEAAASGYSTPGIQSGVQTPLPAYGTQTPRSGYQTPAPPYGTPPPMPNGFPQSVSLVSLPQVPSGQARESGSDDGRLGQIREAPNQRQQMSEKQSYDDIITPVTPSAKLFGDSPPRNPFSDENAGTWPLSQQVATVSEMGKQDRVVIRDIDVKPTIAPLSPGPAATPIEPATEASKEPAKPAPTKRIDYLAGLVAVACLGVTLHHFCQTFWPYVTQGYGPGAHYPKAEKWLQIFLGSYLLTSLWIGPFFLTATRFLSSNYLKNGKLEDIAKKELRRAPRLFVPIIIVSLLEYFLISMGLTSALEWLPSISWATWPYVTAQPNFGVYLNNIVELAYLMPNAIPEVVSHYCIGVLWTVPVQLQFTYVVLAASVVIRDIKTPWKRFGFYAMVILAAWYAKVSQSTLPSVACFSLTMHRAGLPATGPVSSFPTSKRHTSGRSTSTSISGSNTQSWLLPSCAQPVHLLSAP
jgi:hypothetical protein